MKVLCIGRTCFDISCPVDASLVENSKYYLTEKMSSGGGSASNTAYLLGKWGLDTSIATVVGSDDFGEKIKKEFQSVGVKTEYVETAYEKETSLSFILINKTNGMRTVFNISNEFIPLKKMDYDFTPDIIYTDGYDYGATQNAINKYPNALRILVADQPKQEIVELCKYMTYIICSKGFAEAITGLKFDYNNPSTLVNVYSKLQGRFSKAIIVVTLGEKGALYMVNNQIKIMPGLKIEVKDSTGAGDIFHGAFTYGLANNFDLEKTITLANIAGGLSVKTLGSRLSVPPLSEVLDYYAKKFGVNNQIPNNAPAPNVEPTGGSTNTNVSNGQNS